MRLSETYAVWCLCLTSNSWLTTRSNLTWTKSNPQIRSGGMSVCRCVVKRRPSDMVDEQSRSNFEPVTAMRLHNNSNERQQSHNAAMSGSSTFSQTQSVSQLTITFCRMPLYTALSALSECRIFWNASEHCCHSACTVKSASIRYRKLLACRELFSQPLNQQVSHAATNTQPYTRTLAHS